MNRNRKLLLTSLLLGLMSLAVAILAGMHLQHLVDDGHSRHPGEVVVLLILALVLFSGSVWACQRDRNAGWQNNGEYLFSDETLSDSDSSGSLWWWYELAESNWYSVARRACRRGHKCHFHLGLWNSHKRLQLRFMGIWRHLERSGTHRCRDCHSN